MKFRRIVAVAATATIAAGALAPAASAQYPEPLNQVIHEMQALGGHQAPNLLLVPAALSSLNIVLSIILGILAAI